MSVNKRRRFKEWEVVATLMEQGIVIPCFRCKEPLPLPTTPKQIQREHIHELALDGPDIPANCRFSHADCHAVITNGTKATSAGSSKHRIAKLKRILNAPRLSKRAVSTSGKPCPADFANGNLPPLGRKLPITESGEMGERSRRESHSQQGAGADEPISDSRETRLPTVKSRWPQGRKIQSRGFQKAART